MYKVRWLMIPVIGVALVMALALRTPAPAQAITLPLTYISPATQTIPTGTFSVDIVISNVTGLYGADVQFSFDPTLVSVVDASASPGVQVTLGPLLTSGSGGFLTARNTANNVTGTVWVALTELYPSDPITGSGVLAHVTFQPLRTGTGFFHITNHDLADHFGSSLSNLSQDGLVIIGVAAAVNVASLSAREEPSDVSAVTSGWPLLVFGAAGVFVVMGVVRLRKRR